MRTKIHEFFEDQKKKLIPSGELEKKEESEDERKVRLYKEQMKKLQEKPFNRGGGTGGGIRG